MLNLYYLVSVEKFINLEGISSVDWMPMPEILDIKMIGGEKVRLEQKDALDFLEILKEKSEWVVN